MKWSITFSDQPLHQGILRLHKVNTRLKSTGGWGLCSAQRLLGSAQQSMETCLKVLLLGSRDSAKYRVALIARYYFGVGWYISNEVVPCPGIVVICACQISCLGSWSWREPSCAGSWTWYSPFLKELTFPTDFGIFTLIYGNPMELLCNNMSISPWLKL